MGRSYGLVPVFLPRIKVNLKMGAFKKDN